MKAIVSILILSCLLFGNMGDCFRCHPQLQNDKVHDGMKTCIRCHSRGKSLIPECGAECFSCHTKNDMDLDTIAEHEIFEKCRECHVTKIHKMFDPTTTFDQSHQETLQDIFKN